MTRIVCISDTHLKHGNIKIPDGDVLIHAGDITNRGYIKRLAKFARWLKKQPHEHKIVIAGNHDRCFEEKPWESRGILAPVCDYLEDRELIIDGVKFYGSPWQPAYNDWAFNLPKRGDELKEKWAMIPSDTDVLITHGPPAGILDRNQYGELCGCWHLLQRMRDVKPKLHVFGHIHESYGTCSNLGTTFVNAAICSLDKKSLRQPVVVDITEYGAKVLRCAEWEETT